MTDTPETPKSVSPAAPAATAERIAKVIARSGVASRRDAEKMILDGRVSVNGKKVASPALDVTPADKVAIDGKPIDAPQETRLWLYYKPLGLVSTEKDEQGRRTIFDEMPEGMPRVLNVGRLDLNSEGLLLLTNDGGLKRRLELPETGWLRKYRVRVNGRPLDDTFDPLRRGITIEGEEFQPMEISLDRQQGANAWLTVGIREGKNREIRRAMAEVGMTVNRLIRVSYGPFRLDDMQPGDVVEVKRKVLREQLGDRLLLGVEDGRPSRAERMAPKPRGAAGEDRPARRGPRPEGGAAERKPFARREEGDAPKRPYTPRGEGAEGKRPYARREEGDAKPRSFGAKSHRDGEEKRPYARREDGDAPKRPYTPRSEGAEGKRPYARREEGDAPKRPYAPRGEGAEGKRPYARREDGDAPKRAYAPRGEGAEGKRPYARREDGDAPKRPYAPRGEGAEGKRPYTRREEGDAKPRSYGTKSHRDGEEKRPYARREEGDAPKRAYTPRGEGAEGKRPYARREEGDAPKRPYTPRGEGAGGKPAAKSAGFKSHGTKPGAKPRAEGFKSHAGKPATGVKRPPRGEGKGGPKRG